MVSAAAQPAATVVSLPGRDPVAVAVRELEPAGARAVRTGSHVAVPHDPALRPADGLSVSTWLWLAPGAPLDARRALLATWGEGGDGWALALDRGGRPCFEVGAGGQRDRVACERPVERGVLVPARCRARPGHRDDRADPSAPPRPRARSASSPCAPAPRRADRDPGRARCCSAPSPASGARPSRTSTASSTGRWSRRGRDRRPRSRRGASARAAGRASSTAVRAACTERASTARCAP